MDAVPPVVFALFDSFQAKDRQRLFALFTDDAEIYDPHYPRPHMAGRVAVERGLSWALRTLEKPGFTVRHVWIDGSRLAAEVDTHHVVRGPIRSQFAQLFVIDVRDDRIARLRAYVPYRADGIGGAIARLTGLSWRLRGW